MINPRGPQFAVVREWDGSYSRVTWYAMDAEVRMVYRDGEAHLVTREYFDSIYVGSFDPNVY